MQRTLSIAQRFHLSAAFHLLQRPRAHYPNTDSQWNDRQTVFNSLYTQGFFPEWVVKPIKGADMLKSVPPFMFCLVACRKEEGEEDGGRLLVMPHNTRSLTASFTTHSFGF